MRTLVSLALAALALASCGAGETAETTTPSTAVSTTVAGVTPTSSPDDPAVHPGLASRVALAVTDLAERLAVPESEIEVVSAQPVTWPDSSLGCPEPGMQYAQVMTDGARIELASGGTTYSYHMGGSTYVPFLCERPAGSIPPKVTSGSTITVPELEPDPTDESVPPPGYDE
jgi:hypothetical protein